MCVWMAGVWLDGAPSLFPGFMTRVWSLEEKP